MELYIQEYWSRGGWKDVEVRVEVEVAGITEAMGPWRPVAGKNRMHDQSERNRKNQ